MSPYEIEVLMSFYTLPSAHNSNGDPLYIRAIDVFVECGALEADDELNRGYSITRLGIAWVTAIKSVEIPRAVYVDLNGEIIKDLNGKPV